MSGFRLSDAQRLDWLRLIRSERIGPRTFRALVNQFGGAAAALDALPDLAGRAGRGRLKIASRAEAEREMEAARRQGIRFIAQGEGEYPKTLLAIDTAPPLIALAGSAEVLLRPTVAIVGSRNASAAGALFTERLATDLGRAGYVVVSGLARGIDARAHAAAVATGTIAVLAGGHERIYPAENRPLLERLIAEGGAAISEMPLAWEPRGRDFPRRNRIVSGIAYGVVVVEAARRSGSLITARFALEQGREVFAVPGSPLDPRAEGTNDLIRNGATLCAGAEHVVSVLAPLIGGEPPPVEGRYREPGADPYGGGRVPLWDELDLAGGTEAPTGELPLDPVEPFAERDRVLAALTMSPVSIDDLGRQTGLTVRTLRLVLVELELAGSIDLHPAGSISRRP